MPLFPSEATASTDAASITGITREGGTKKIIIGCLAIAALWFFGSKGYDAFLLQKKWDSLQPDTKGLTILATLDSRGSYELNTFKIVNAEGQSRAELTKAGMQRVFDVEVNKVFEGDTAGAVMKAIGQDSITGFRMLQPFLQAAISTEMKQPNAFDSIKPDYKVLTDHKLTNAEKKQKKIPEREVPLKVLLDYFAAGGDENIGADEVVMGGGSGTDKQVEHGLVIPAEVLLNACPVVLTTAHFSGAWIEEHPPAVVGGVTYTLHLQLTPEGRSRFYQWTRSHEQESLLLIEGNRVRASGRIKMTLDVNDWQITNLKDKENLDKIVEAITKKS